MSSLPPQPFLPTLYEDLRVLGVHHPSAFNIFVNLARASFRAVFLYRICAALHNSGPIAKAVAMSVMNINMALHGCDIWPYAIIGPGLYLPHPTGIEIGPIRIGHHATIMQRVTFGLRYADDDIAPYEGRPVLGDHVIVSAGAVITGSVKIGDYALIGPNAVVLQDVPPHCSADGAPARVTLAEPRKAA